MKPKTQIRLVTEDMNGQPFLIMSIRDAISREVADFLDLVPVKEEALHVLMDAIDRGFSLNRKRSAHASDAA